MANKLVKYVLECKEELKKVTWPSRDQIIRDTSIVIGMSLGVAIFFGVVDFGMMEALKKYLQV